MKARTVSRDAEPRPADNAVDSCNRTFAWSTHSSGWRSDAEILRTRAPSTTDDTAGEICAMLRAPNCPFAQGPRAPAKFVQLQTFADTASSSLRGDKARVAVRYANCEELSRAYVERAAKSFHNEENANTRDYQLTATRSIKWRKKGRMISQDFRTICIRRAMSQSGRNAAVRYF